MDFNENLPIRGYSVVSSSYSLSIRLVVVSVVVVVDLAVVVESGLGSSGVVVGIGDVGTDGKFVMAQSGLRGYKKCFHKYMFKAFVL